MFIFANFVDASAIFSILEHIWSWNLVFLFFYYFFFFYCFIRYNSPISEIHQPQFVKSKSMRSRRYPFPSIQYTNVWTGSGDRSVSIYHDSLSRIANNQAENRCVVQRSCKKYVSSWRQQQREWFRMKEKKEEEGERREEKERQKERERETLTTKTSFLVRMAL